MARPLGVELILAVGMVLLLLFSLASTDSTEVLLETVFSSSVSPAGASGATSPGAPSSGLSTGLAGGGESEMFSRSALSPSLPLTRTSVLLRSTAVKVSIPFCVEELSNTASGPAVLRGRSSCPPRRSREYLLDVFFVMKHAATSTQAVMMITMKMINPMWGDFLAEGFG